MQITVRPLDLGSDADLDAVARIDDAHDQLLFGGVEPATVAQQRSLFSDSPYSSVRVAVAEVEQMEGQVIAGYASVSQSLQENLDTVYVDITVHPALRGHGVGTALLEQAVIPMIRETGRTLVSAWAAGPSEGEVEDPALPQVKLAHRLGLERRNVAVCRALSLPIDPELLRRLGAEAAEKIGDYRVEVWDDEIPEEHLETYGTLLTQLEVDDPDEEFEYEAATYTPDRLRTMQQRRRERGIRVLTAVAIAPDGSFAGNSELHWRRTEGTTLCWQENTLVMPQHRGHRLGLALKVATHARIGELAPGVEQIVTWNSHVNPWMIAINEKLGYQVRFREIAYQGRPAATAPRR
ncbi:GNAT family N-acetyltransferase [Brachybacterium sp. EF45031]|uniref:GNAT family N-acetyltransferase n=1 Tax=Brachybacterium sillae TaxID=2810536 RepID=UPI00217DD70D|nr:GNAT family N-acetyltransferase [Brachybacterium sillae]MCS6711657.1 GNAT family N-acetyltransferase [Brachybacterium sillae]